MKLHLDSNTVEGTPEELVKYQELLEDKKQVTFQGVLGSLKIDKSSIKSKESSTEEAEATKGYTFWYIDGSKFNNRNVIKTTIRGYYEDSKGNRYTHHKVKDLIKPINSKNIRKFFEDAKRRGNLLKYYPSVDGFVRE